ncbi:MAG: ArnT family glycosyltransferase [Sandaracinaceae bacterium]
MPDLGRVSGESPALEELAPGAAPVPAPTEHEQAVERAVWRSRAAWLIGALTMVRLWVTTATPLGNGEAYYLAWSRFPSLSYFDHPPLVALLGSLARIGGASRVSARLGSVLMSFLLGVLLYRLGERLFGPRAGFLALALVSALPAFVIHGYALNPEAALAPLWVLVLLEVQAMREGRSAWHAVVAGGLVGVAFLAKYTAILLVPSTFLYLATSPPMRPWLRRPVLYLGGLAALGAASPVILWNATHGWASVAYHLVERTAAGPAIDPALRAQEVLAGLAFFYSPLFLPLLLGGAWVAWRRRKDDRYRFLLAYSVPALGFFLAVLMRVAEPEHHWTMVAFLGLSLIAGALVDELYDRSSRLRTYWWGALTLSLVAFLTVNIHLHTPLVVAAIPEDDYDGRYDFGNELFAWPDVTRAVRDAARRQDGGVVAAGSYYSICGKLLDELNDDPPVFCPGARSAFHDFGRALPPDDHAVIYLANDRYPQDPGPLLPEHACREEPGVEHRKAGRVVRRYRLWTCTPRRRVAGVERRPSGARATDGAAGRPSP